MPRSIATLVLVLAATLASCGDAPKSDSGDWRSGIKELKMAVSGNSDEPMAIRRRAVYQQRLSEATGLPVKLYESADYNGLIQALSSGQVDVAQMAGGAYANVDAQVGKLVSPILSLRQAEGEMGSYSTLVVRADSPVRSLQDMKGRTLGYVDFNSTSSYVFPRAKMREQGIEPDTFFGKTSFAGAHTQAVMALSNGQFEGTILNASGGSPETGFTRGPLHTLARRGLVDLEDFRVVWTAGPIPGEAFVVRTDRPQPMIDLIRGAVAALPYDEPELWPELGQLDGATFSAVTRDHYKVIIDQRAAELAHRRGSGDRR